MRASSPHLPVGPRQARAHDAAWLATQGDSTATTVAGWAFVVGVALFSGSLYTMTLTGMKWLGAITPLGGVAFIIGWIALAVAGSKLLS